MNKSGYCPSCESDDLDYETIVQEQNGIAYYPFRCNSCGISGKEWYSLKFSKYTIDD